MSTEIQSFEEWEKKWNKEQERSQLQFSMEIEGPKRDKRDAQGTMSATFICDHCQEKGRGDPHELPDPSGEVGPQGSFCSAACAKATALYEVGRGDIADLIDKMAGLEVVPAPPWSSLMTVRQTDGLTRDDWTGDMLIDDSDVVEEELGAPIPKNDTVPKKTKK